jgi:hypothetical protein
MKDIIRKLLKESLIGEMSVNNISSTDFNVKEIEDNWLMSNPETIVQNFKYDMQDEYDLSPEEKEEIMHGDMDEIQETDRFKKWLRYTVEYRIDDFIDSIQRYYFTDNNEINIWRKMTVDQKWIDQLLNPKISGQRVGRYWSFEEDAAEAHWGNFNDLEIKLYSRIPEQYVDWTQTIEANIDLSIGDDEKEITLFKNTPIKILGLEVNNKPIDISKIGGKVFKV